MRGKSSPSPSKSKNGIFEAENKLGNISESHLSGAYIRSLVKQLSSSRTKGHGQVVSADISCGIEFSDHDRKQERPHQPPTQHKKKQVRRRLHTCKPYQERLLNMAEARREIVTALKLHRAAMKKAKEEEEEEDGRQQQKTESGHTNQPFKPSPDQITSLEQDAKSNSWRNPRIYASNSGISNQFPKTHLDNFSYTPGIYAPSSYSMPPPPPLVHENFINFSLPNQALGLNLNLQDFSNLDASAISCSNNNPSSIYSSSSSASTSSSPLSAYTEEAPCIAAQGSALHHAMGGKEMDELRSIGEQHQMEWNDNLNLVNSAWWCKCLHAMEVGTANKRGDDLVKSSPFDEVVEFPPWLNANDEFRVKDDYFQDPALPCMDIGDIEGMDADWLA